MDFSSKTISGSFAPGFGKRFGYHKYVLIKRAQSGGQSLQMASGSPYLLHIVHVQPVLVIQVCSHLLQVHTACWDPIPTLHAGITWEGERGLFHLQAGLSPAPGTVPSQLSPPCQSCPSLWHMPTKPGLPGLTIVQGDEEDPLDHVVDVELLAELSLRAERAADLGHRIVAVVQALGNTVVGVILADGRLLACMTEPSASRGPAPVRADRLAPSPGSAPAPAPASTSPPVSCRSCCCFWTAAKCLAAATEPKRAAKGLLEMLLLFSWSVISPQGLAIRVSRGKAAGKAAVRARARSPRARRARPARCGGSGANPAHSHLSRRRRTLRVTASHND